VTTAEAAERTRREAGQILAGLAADGVSEG
jgi:hypothetical protein